MRPTTYPLISVIIPAYNEGKSITRVIAQAETILKSLQLPYEVLVVDDGSKDDTKEKASKNGATVVSYNRNRGKGYALRKGLAHARGQIFVTMDADGSHRPNDIPRIIKPLLYGADIVIGSRFIANNRKTTSRLHMFGNYIFNVLIMIITKKKITDSQSGFRAFRKNVLKGVVLFSNGYEIESELIIKTLRNGFKIREESIVCEKRKNGRSKLRTVSDGFMIFKTILKSTFI